MNPSKEPAVIGIVVDDRMQFTLAELSRICQVDIALVIELVDEGILTPNGDEAERWMFGGTTLRRVRKALRLTRDLELNAASAALVLDLLDEIETLRARLRRLGSS